VEISKTQTNFLGHDISSPIFNASGPLCVTLEDLEALDRSRASMMITKSCTLAPRLGNILPRYQSIASGSINSMGLPNLGLSRYLEYAQIRSPQAKKPYVLSIAGLSLEENRYLLVEARSNRALGAIELNLSCPNIPGKPQLGYDLPGLESTLHSLIFDWDPTHVPIGVKLPPYFDPSHWDEVTEILNRFDALHFVTTINSPGNGLSFLPNSCEVSIAPKNGLGGIGGALIKPFALSNVRELRLRLRSEIAVVGCGGVTHGRDVLEHLLCGAQCVQVGTQFYAEGISVFDRLNLELNHELSKLGFHSVDEARGKWSAQKSFPAHHVDEYDAPLI